MDVTAELTGECTEVLTAAATTQVLPPIITVLLRTITALPPITAVPAFTLVSGSRPEARQPRNKCRGRSARTGRPSGFT